MAYKPCQEGQIRNPETKRCVKIDGVIGKKIIADMKSKSKSPSPKEKKSDLKKSIIKHLSVIRDYEIMNGNLYKKNAYNSVLAQLYAYDGEIHNYQDFIDNIKAGEKINLKIKELIDTNKITYEENIKKDENYYFTQELRKIYGIGESNILKILKAGIKSIDELKTNTHLLNNKQKIGLKYYKDLNKRIPRDEYLKHKKILEKDLKEKDLIYDFVGSFRRESSYMGDIDFLVMKSDNFDLPAYVKNLKDNGYIIEILALGKVKFSGIVKLDDDSIARQVDILVAPENEYYYSLLYFTGSAEFNIGMRNFIKNKYGISLSEHGFDKDFIKIPIMKKEKEIFDLFNIKYVEPEKRKVFYPPL